MMHKTMALLCVFCFSSFYGMENNAGNQSDSVIAVSYESELIQNLRVSKKKFEQDLDWAGNAWEKGKKSRQEHFTGAYYDYLDTLYRDKQGHEDYYMVIMFKPFFEKIEFSPTILLNYCYYLKHFQFDWRKHIGQLVASSYLLDTCRESRKGDGYSALGAVIIAHDVSIEVKRNVIQKLLSHGFEFTKEDRALAELDFYDAIPVEQKAKMIFLLCHENHEDSLWQLLPEIRKYIVQYFLSLLDKEHGFCIQ